MKRKKPVKFKPKAMRMVGIKLSEPLAEIGLNMLTYKELYGDDLSEFVGKSFEQDVTFKS